LWRKAPAVVGLHASWRSERIVTIQAKPLEPEHFIPYGTVGQALRPSGTRVEAAWFGEQGDHGRPLNLAYAGKAETPAPLRIGHLERHRLSSLANGRPDLSRLAAFVARSQQAVCYGKGVWHAPMHLLDRPGSYMAARNCHSMRDDLELFELPEALEIAIPGAEP
jgi:ureidoglycolate lyase